MSMRKAVFGAVAVLGSISILATALVAGAAQGVPVGSSKKGGVGDLAERTAALIDRKALQGPNPALADPNVVDGFRLDNGNVIYFNSATNAYVTQPYSAFIERNPLYEIPLPALRPERFMRASNHTFTITAPWRLSGGTLTTTVPVITENVSTQQLGCAMTVLATRNPPSEPIQGLTAVGTVERVIGSATRSTSSSGCREFNFNPASAPSEGDHLFPNAARQVVVRISHYTRPAASTSVNLLYPYEYEGHVPFGPQYTFSSQCNGTDNFIKVDMAYNYGAATARRNGTGWVFDSRGHFQGLRPENYVNTRIYKICVPTSGAPAATNDSTTMTASAINMASFGALSVNGDYNPNGGAPAGRRAISGYFYDCNSTVAISGTRAAVVTRNGIAANCPTGGSQASFHINTASNSMPATFGVGSNDMNLIPTLRFNADNGVLVGKNASNNPLFWVNNSFQTWHSLAVAVPERLVSYLTRVNSASVNGAVPGGGTALSTGCAVTGGPGAFQCTTSSGNAGPAEVTYAEAEANCIAACGVNGIQPGCPAQTFTWGSGIGGATSNSCTANVPALNHNGEGTYSNTAGTHSGSVSLRCNAGSLVTTAPPSCSEVRCAAQSLSWRNNCSAPVPNSSVNGSYLISNTAPGYTGSARATCLVPGVWDMQAGSLVCDPAPVVQPSCAPRQVNWSESGRSCSAMSPQLSQGESRTLSTTSGTAGYVSIACNAPPALAQSKPTCGAELFTGRCGPADGASYPTYPSSGHCLAGTREDTDTSGGDGSFNWRCNGSLGRPNAFCSATNSSVPPACPFGWFRGPDGTCRDPNGPVNGACGSAAGVPTASYPSGGHCSAGTLSTQDGGGADGEFNWACYGTNGGNSATCSAPNQAASACPPGQRREQGVCVNDPSYCPQCTAPPDGVFVRKCYAYQNRAGYREPYGYSSGQYFGSDEAFCINVQFDRNTGAPTGWADGNSEGDRFFRYSWLDVDCQPGAPDCIYDAPSDRYITTRYGGTTTYRDYRHQTGGMSCGGSCNPSRQFDPRDTYRYDRDYYRYPQDCVYVEILSPDHSKAHPSPVSYPPAPPPGQPVCPRKTDY